MIVKVTGFWVRRAALRGGGYGGRAARIGRPSVVPVALARLEGAVCNFGLLPKRP
jgi:hypothetical protein